MSESDETPTNNGGKVCGLCNNDPSKYCCPRCEVLYCSLDCYKSEKHIDCSEGFYRDCVNNELTSVYADQESQRKMLEILKRMHNDNGQENDEEVEEILENVEFESDDEEEIDLHERINGLNLDYADGLWNALTADEKNEFEALVNQGDVAKFLPAWEPWWLYRRKNNLIQEVEKSDNETKALEKCPSLKTVPKFSDLTSVQPSPAIKNNITNVLASYVFIARYFMGDIDPIEGTTCLLDICCNLNSNANFDDMATAVESAAQKCLQNDFIQTDKESLDVMKRDTFLVLQGPSEDNSSYYCQAALSHLHQLFHLAKSQNKCKTEDNKQKGSFSKKFPDHKSCHLPKQDVAKLMKCMKKVEFYLSYVGEYGLSLD